MRLDLVLESLVSDYFKNVDMGSITAPILFNIMIHDLPTAMSHYTSKVQNADDIAI